MRVNTFLGILPKTVKLEVCVFLKEIDSASILFDSSFGNNPIRNISFCSRFVPELSVCICVGLRWHEQQNAILFLSLFYMLEIVYCISGIKYIEDLNITFADL